MNRHDICSIGYSHSTGAIGSFAITEEILKQLEISTSGKCLFGLVNNQNTGGTDYEYLNTSRGFRP
ncbi:MAG: hypothetical protein N0E38_14975, partial [Candidatus Thiodiazotropha endolucinida]|nr:hypothetical protein [Candidatus Thiodiazotropha taylori]MCW4350238.1 hypothetical protein [Candidatus Thiodiazotropha endolucinida]